MENKNKLSKRDIERRKKLQRRRARKRKMNLILALIIIFLLVLIFFFVKRVFGNKADSKENNPKVLETINENKGNQQKDPKYSDNKIVENSENITIGNNEDSGPIKIIKNPVPESNLSDAEKKNLLKDLPELVKTMPERYPETESTILKFNEFRQNFGTIDIKKDYDNSKRYERKVKLPYFSQWDPRWGFRDLGKDDYMAVISCGPTALSMIYTGLTGDTTKDPYTLSKEFFGTKYFNSNGSMATLFTEGAKKLGLTGSYIGTSEKELKQALNQGKIVVALVREKGIGDFTRSGHYIILSELTNDCKLKIYDPNSYINTNKDWEIDRVLKQTDVLLAIWK